MRCPWLVPSLLVCMACSGEGVRSGSFPEPADFLPMATDTAVPAYSVVIEGDTLGTADAEQPRLIFRCEEGRVDAYLIVDTSAAVESGRLDERAVPVSLDSTLSC